MWASLFIALTVVGAPAKTITATQVQKQVPPAPPTPPPVALPSLPGAVDAFRNIPMMPLSSLGSTDEAVRAVERVLVGELQKLLGPRLIADAQLKKRGALAGDAFEGCEGVVDCLLEVAGALGWDALIVGNIAGLAEGRVINLKMFDVRTGDVLTRAAEPASGEEKELIAQMRKAAVTLVAPDLAVGNIDLVCAQSDVQILLNGQLIGTTPLEKTRLTVPAGRHAIEATGEGLVPFSTFVEVAYEQQATVTIVLPENTVFVGGAAPFHSRWWPWVVAGAGVIGVGLGVFFNFQQAADVAEIEKRYGAGTLVRPQSDELYASEAANWNRSMGLYIGGGTALGVALSLFISDAF